MSVLEKILALLRESNTPFRLLEHEPTRTSEDSARVRGEPLAIGAKALILKVDASYRLIVLSASLRIDSRRVREHFGAQSIRFATPEELMHRTGLVPGSVPPFGRPVLDIDLYVDESVLRNDRMAFNAGSLTHSIVMATADYCAVTRPEIVSMGRTA